MPAPEYIALAIAASSAALPTVAVIIATLTSNHVAKVRFDGLDRRLDRIDSRFDTIDAELRYFHGQSGRIDELSKRVP